MNVDFSQDAGPKGTSACDPARAGKLAQQIVAILGAEDRETRQRAIQAALALLGDPPPRSVEKASLEEPTDRRDDQTDLAKFFDRDDELKPADSAYLCAAYHFSQFGVVPFSLAEIREIATSAGVVVPDRLDMTFRQAAKKGKKLFQRAGSGLFKPTATGSIEFGERWNVRPGRQTKPTSSARGLPDAQAR